MNFTMFAERSIRKVNPLRHDKPRFRVQISGGATRRYEGNNSDAPLSNESNFINLTMGKIRPGSKINSFLNGEWAKHVKAFRKKITSSKRRMLDKKIIKQSLDEFE